MEEGGNHVGHPDSTTARPIEQHLAVLHCRALGLQPIYDPVRHQQHPSELMPTSWERQWRGVARGGGALEWYPVSRLAR